MTTLEILQEALKELGEPSAEEIARRFHEKYGVRLNPHRVPILRASLAEKAMLDRVRRRAAAQVAETDSAGSERT